MRDFWQQCVKFFVSLQLTVVLLALSMILVFVATLDQVNLGIWAVQEKYFRSFVVLWNVNGIPIPVFPGGYFIGGLLLINLVASHFYRFKLSWQKSGIVLTHFGLIFLLVGELLTGLWQEEFQMRMTRVRPRTTRKASSTTNSPSSMPRIRSGTRSWPFPRSASRKGTPSSTASCRFR